MEVGENEILGYGSHGTVVMRGRFQGREVAVKRVLLDFYTVAEHEVAILQASDDHAHIVRYFGREQCDRFAYIAVERCVASLADLLTLDTTSKGPWDAGKDLPSLPSPPRILRHIALGLEHLHRLRLVHRDLKPQNLLLSTSGRILVSDFGLCKKLEGPVSSFGLTHPQGDGMAGGMVGTVGWRAPECLAHAETESSLPPRFTRAVDIFSTGCIFYYVLTKGMHPFGERYAREGNILLGKPDLSLLDDTGSSEDALAHDLISSMLAYRPKNRPSAADVLAHPYFWSPATQLTFLMDLSDRLERERRPGKNLTRLPSGEVNIIGDWRRRVDAGLLADLGRRRTYDGGSVRELLRAIRNKRHHFQELAPKVRALFADEGPEAYLAYWSNRFPRLLLWVWRVAGTWAGSEDGERLRDEGMLRHYFAQELPEH
ncbi:MAG: kinase-like domain-containing protein [Piptocephalis tieghemiana]|nr:MAG: kinase-like domain-containing protein [Piptocephalis tieghemiana]